MYSQGHAKAIILYTIEMKASLSEWNNHQEEGEKGFGGVFKIQPLSTIKDSYFKKMSNMSIKHGCKRAFIAK
jgi:hypothetical protein